MKKYLFITLLLAINSIANAQSNYLKTVVINNNGDSLYGDIDYRNWKYNPQTITFINATKEKLHLDASSIKGFYIPSAKETYASFTVEMDMIPGDQDQAINNSFIDSPTLKKRVFLLQLVSHPALRLYQFTDNHKEHFYYLKGNEEPVELIHHYLFDESTKQVLENAAYKVQLSGLFEACPAVAEKSNKIKFRIDEIKGIVLKYLQCIAPGSVADIKKEDSTSFKFGIVAGLMSNKFEFTGDYEFLVDENYSGKISPVFGVSLDIGLSRNLNKWHIINEIIYKSYKTSSSFSRRRSDLFYARTSVVSFDFSYAQINTIARYIFQSKASLKPFINIGIGSAFIIAENKNNVHTIYSTGLEENVKALEGPGPKKYEFSALGGAGLTFRNFQMELRYGTNKSGFSYYHTLHVNPKSYQCIFTYQF